MTTEELHRQLPHVYGNVEGDTMNIFAPDWISPEHQQEWIDFLKMVYPSKIIVWNVVNTVE